MIISRYRFRLIKEHLVEFNQLAAAHAEGSQDMLNRVMLRDNIGIMALLETVEPGVKQKLIVTNAHIHWDPEYRDVKLIQVVMLMKELSKFMQEVSPSNAPGSKGNCFIKRRRIREFFINNGYIVRHCYLEDRA